jgi:NDP-hexose-3-ketoreductase
MIKKMRIGILGCSNIAKKAVIPAIQSLAQIELAACAARDIERAIDFADRHHCVAMSYEDLLKSDSIDAVYISLPVGLHFKWADKALDEGKHVLLEKTFTRTLHEANQLIDKAQRNNLIIMEALMYVFHPLLSTVKEKLREIGPIKHIDSYFAVPDLDPTNIRYQKNLGGGAAFDNLIYPLSFFIECVKTVYPQLDPSNFLHDGNFEMQIIKEISEEHGVDLSGKIYIRFAEMTAHLVYGFGFSYRNEYSVWGKNGSIKAQRVFSRPADFENEIEVQSGNHTSNLFIKKADQFAQMLIHFYECVRDMRQSGTNLNKDILHRIELIEHIYNYH